VTGKGIKYPSSFLFRWPDVFFCRDVLFVHRFKRAGCAMNLLFTQLFIEGTFYDHSGND
jgi:hypothetical protein